MTVEEVLLAIVAAAATVLLFFGLAEALESEKYARLRARRRRLSRYGVARPPLEPGAPPPRRPLARRLSGPAGAGSPTNGRTAGPRADASEAVVADRWAGAVARLIRGREWGEARRLVDPALESGDLRPEQAAFLLDVCSTAVARDLWRLRRGLRRGTGDEAPLTGCMEMTRAFLAAPVAAGLPAAQRRHVRRRLWRANTRLGLGRWREGEFEAAVEYLFQATAGPEVDERRRRLAGDLLVRALEDLAGTTLEVIPQLLDDGDRAAALARAQRLLGHIRRAREEGVSTEDLAVSASRARRLLEQIEHSPVR
jgi:hypothetical protein